MAVRSEAVLGPREVLCSCCLYKNHAGVLSQSLTFGSWFKVHPTMGQIQLLSAATSQQPCYAGEGPSPPRRLTDGLESSHQKDLLKLGRKHFHDWCSSHNAGVCRSRTVNSALLLVSLHEGLTSLSFHLSTAIDDNRSRRGHRVVSVFSCDLSEFPQHKCLALPTCPSTQWETSITSRQ